MSAELWLADIGIFEEESIPFFLSFLNHDETGRYRNFRRAERRRQFLAGRILLRLAVAEFAGIHPRHVGVVERLGNAPLVQLPHDAGRYAPCISLSHSGKWAGCALCVPAAIGLDLEMHDKQRRFEDIARLAFHPDEYAWLQSLPESDRQSSFYRIWTCREALLKFLSAQGRLDNHVSLASLPESIVTDVADTGRRFSCLSHEDISIALCCTQEADVRQRIIGRADLLSLAGERDYEVRANTSG